MPVDENYRSILREAVDAAGGQYAIAERVGISQSTVSRALKRGQDTTYTTLSKLSSALPGMPAPSVAVRDQPHERWCRIGALLAEHSPKEFENLLGMAEFAASHVRPTTAQLDQLEAVIRDPMPRGRKKSAGK